MAVRIRNLVVSGPVLVPLSTGTTVRLSPGQVSDDLPEVEVANNAKVDKLRRQGLIDVETPDRPDEQDDRPDEQDDESEDRDDRPAAQSEDQGESGDGSPTRSRPRSRKRTNSPG